ncbi:hypothetical protein CEXT_181951 [Caerostris extrusa]|uniref:Uncharacterized protein n=1 Tax=Caerostris extrusa TaxID=172846 RepID=A0AAV4Y3G4_CAEEX|nr:hypothetical protein CEXT_181951 [Caerostris extrusa]
MDNSPCMRTIERVFVKDNRCVGTIQDLLEIAALILVAASAHNLAASVPGSVAAAHDLAASIPGCVASSSRPGSFNSGVIILSSRPGSNSFLEDLAAAIPG